MNLISIGETFSRAGYELLGLDRLEVWNEKHIERDVSNEEWAFVAPYLTLMTEDAPQRVHNLREIFNG